MIRVLALIACLVPVAALAQSNLEPPADMRAAHDMMHGQHMMYGQATPRSAIPIQPGQSAFAAIQEIVEILSADPKTDWSKVNIDALQRYRRRAG